MYSIGFFVGVFARFDGQSLVAHVLQSRYLAADFVLRQLAARDGAVLGVIGAVDAAVHAVVRKVERGEHHDAVAVEAPLELACEREHALRQLGAVAFEQYGRLAVAEAPAFGGLVENLGHERFVVAVAGGIFQRPADLCVVDELGGFV